MAFNNIPPNGFPALPDVEDLEAVEKDVTSLKSSVLGLTQDVTDLNAQKANQITIAPFFNSETSYDVGDLVYYNGLSYRCTNSHEGEWDADDFAPTTIANELSSLMSGLTRQLTVSVTLPATTNGRSSVQLPDTTIPVGAKVVGYALANVSTYSDAVSISVYFIGRTARVTMVGSVDEVPQITLDLMIGITY